MCYLEILSFCKCCADLTTTCRQQKNISEFFIFVIHAIIAIYVEFELTLKEYLLIFRDNSAIFNLKRKECFEATFRAGIGHNLDMLYMLLATNPVSR